VPGRTLISGGFSSFGGKKTERDRSYSRGGGACREEKTRRARELKVRKIENQILRRKETGLEIERRNKRDLIHWKRAVVKKSGA